MTDGGSVRRWLGDAAGSVFAVLGTGGVIIFLLGAGFHVGVAVGMPVGVAGLIGWIWWAVGQANRKPPAGVALTSGEVDAIRVRIEDLELLQARLAELEERVDFAERLLVRPGEPETVRRLEEGR